MIKENLKHWIGFVLLISIICFFFYKSVFNETSVDDALQSIENIHGLQVQLHRDLLRYRSNKIKGYDTLNKTQEAINKNIIYLNDSPALNEIAIAADITELSNQINNELTLVEDFKTHHSILQNSLSYIFNLSTELYSSNPTPSSLSTAQLITLLLEYYENPEHKVANKIFPLIDALNVNPDTNTNALINHSLMIIERLPEIDEILSKFNSLNVEKQIIKLRNKTTEIRDTQNSNSKIFYILLFISTLYLIFYILYIFTTLRKHKDELSSSNDKLNREIEHRERTEKALYQLVHIDKNIKSDDDRLLFLLDALCKALNAEYAYISKINATGEIAEILGFLDHGMFSKNITYPLKDTPCEEVINTGRLVHNSDFANYYPNCSDDLLRQADSYIGIRLTDKNKNLIGMMAIASDYPIEDTNLAENILTIATSRAVLELEHQIELNNITRYQQGLSLIDNWIARLITEGYDKKAFYRNICVAAQEITNAQLATFPVLHKDKRHYSFLSSTGTQSDLFEGISLDVEEGGLCAWAISNNKILRVNDMASDTRAPMKLSDQLNTNAALLAPVTLKEKSYGAIAVFKLFDEFDKVDEQLMTQFSQSVQMAIINMQLVSDIKTERERAEVTLHSIGDAVITTNVNGKIEYMNHVAEALTGWSLDEVKSTDIQDVFRIEDMDTGEAIHDIVISCLEENISIQKSILILLNKNGNKKDIESSISPILNTSGNTEGIVIVFHDETERRRLENTIKYQAAHDPLTDLLNRDAFDSELITHVHDANHNDVIHILCYLDLDRFKLINDTGGHAAGDQCLIQVTSLIQSCIRRDDIFGRLGGDEFGLILQNCTHNNALKITGNITKIISEMRFKWEGCDYNLGVSIGINPIDSTTKDAVDAIKKADLACYTAKDQGRGQVYVYEEKDSELIKRQEEKYWATRINETIENNRLCLFAQPIIPLRNRHSHYRHIEILVRLIDEDSNLIPPNAFIPAAERYNLMHLIDRKIILDTFSFINKFTEHDLENTHYSINLSGDTIGHEDIVSYITDMADKFEIDTKSICFEITETTAIKNLKQAQAFIKQLKAVGFKFALDDFGSGLSSFQYLKNLSVDYLKIDGSFVADMVNNNIDHAMVAAINEIGHVMGIKTIAEYVENDQIFKKLQALNVDYGQGYGIEQPQPLEELLSFKVKKTSPALKVINNKP
jgi:diguanylate cyclase (GGDEF)-like protein/PAS domain S-box-containing protein